MEPLYEFKDANGDRIDISPIGNNEIENLIGTILQGKTIASIEPYVDPRMLRDEIFAETIDRMNPVWYNSLSADQKTRLEEFRQGWLNYPSTLVEPETDVTDIF